MATIAIDPRFNGFADVALGGYVGGVLARGRKEAEVILRRPVRLGKPYQSVTQPDGADALLDGDDVLATVRDAVVEIEARPPVGLDDGRLASAQYVGLRRHLVATCFVCGTQRREDDGLRIFPGPVAGRDVVAAPWTPAASLADSSGRVGPEFVWSALDCPTIWGLLHQTEPDSNERAVTARLAVDQISPVHAGETSIVMGWKVSEADRLRVAGGAIYSAEGRLLATAKHTLVTTDWGVPLGLNRWK
jgi:hypothetical protein